MRSMKKSCQAYDPENLLDGLAAPTLLHRGNRSHIPVSGGSKTGSLVWVEKNGKGWNLRVDEGDIRRLDGRLAKPRDQRQRWS